MDTGPLRICMVTSEVAPLAKTGGLADVSAALARYLCAAGHDVRLLMPAYDVIDPALIEPEPVPELQDLHMDLGGERIRYAVDATPLPDGGPVV
jgi:starch synthase